MRSEGRIGYEGGGGRGGDGKGISTSRRSISQSNVLSG